MEIMSLLDEFENVVEESSRIPMTGKVIINEDILYNFLDKLRATMPEAIREAEWILREREKMISEAEKEAETIIETGKSKLQRIAGESEIVKIAKNQGDEMVENAKDVAREIAQGAFTYADEVMAKLQVELEETLKEVKQGREEIRKNGKEKKIKE
ncbi:MAG: ATPase [Clostridia bacterium]|nr:ATPase [Clostridia bacterium]